MRIYNPEGSRLRTDQMKILEVLTVFAQICKENDIKWWLDSGTLLGAARHGGFIPWDDDADVCVLKKDLPKLRRVLRKNSENQFFYSCIQSDVEHVNPFGKFRMKAGGVESTDRRAVHFKYNGMGMDVFAIEYAPKWASHAAKFVYFNLQHPTQYIKNKFVRRLFIRLVEFLSFYILIPPIRVLGWIFNPKKQYHYELGSGFYNAIYYKEQIFPLSTISFEGQVFPAPKDVDLYLTNLYDDWHKIPSEDSIRKRMHSMVYIKEIFGEE